ncbi:MAG: hypothetical protein WCL57_06145 [Chloroflexota bacterium]|jgi:hypothetical protein|nr:hypothetical protein [Chloroflexota bacterium]
MSKKSRRPNLPASAFNTITNISNNGTSASPALATSTPVRIAAAPSRNTSSVKNVTVNWEAEYGEVLGDLKKTGVLALVLLAGMFVLSFIF